MEFIDSGSYSKIFRKGNIAMKFTPHESVVSPWIEIVLLSCLGHEDAENIVAIKGARSTPGGIEMDLELADADLFAYMAEGMDITHTHEIIDGITKGLRVLHQYGVAHADISPRNILVWYDPFQVKISDLGRSFCTKDGLGIGNGLYYNVFYRAPEMWFTPHEILTDRYLRERNFEKADVWALGRLISALVKQESDSPPGKSPEEFERHALVYGMPTSDKSVDMDTAMYELFGNFDKEMTDHVSFAIKCLSYYPENRQCLAKERKSFGKPMILKRGKDFGEALDHVLNYFKRYRSDNLFYEDVCKIVVAIINTAKEREVKYNTRIINEIFLLVSKYYGGSVDLTEIHDLEGSSSFFELVLKHPLQEGFSINFVFE
jgi:serine/threonine protein kinase